MFNVNNKRHQNDVNKNGIFDCEQVNVCSESFQHWTDALMICKQYPYLFDQPETDSEVKARN